MLNLKGWKRVGIIISALWILGWGVRGFHQTDQRLYVLRSLQEREEAQSFRLCADKVGPFQRFTAAQCVERMQSDEAWFVDFDTRSYNPWTSAGAQMLLATVFVPLGWGFFWTIKKTVRWVRLGFQQ